MGWALAHESDGRLYGQLLPFKYGLHPSIREIANPAREPQLASTPARRVTKEHALYNSLRLDVGANALQSSPSPAIAATSARSLSRTDAVLKPLAAAAMRVSAAPTSIGGFVTPFLARWKRTGLMRATTRFRR